MSAELGGTQNTVPRWTLGDRLTKARKMTGMTVAEFAAAIGVSDRTVNNAENDKRAVRPITLNAWALATGVSRSWLETGEGVTPNPPKSRQEESGVALDPVAAFAAQKRRSGRTRRDDADTHRYGDPIAA